MTNFWDFLDHNLKAMLLALFIFVLLGTGLYNVERFINIIEKVALNISHCAK